MTTIDLIVLGIIKQKPLSAYDIQKEVEYRHISKWVKISTPSVYKKVLQLEEKGYIKGTPTKESNMAEKLVYSLTSSGEKVFEDLMLGISTQPINIFLDLNSVIVNLKSISKEKQNICLNNIEESIKKMKQNLIDNMNAKDNNESVSEMGKTVLHQQFILVEAIEKWIKEIREDM